MLSFFPRDVLDEIWDLTGSVSDGFPSYSSIGIEFISVGGHFLLDKNIYFY